MNFRQRFRDKVIFFVEKGKTLSACIKCALPAQRFLPSSSVYDAPVAERCQPHPSLWPSLVFLSQNSRGFADRAKRKRAFIRESRLSSGNKFTGEKFFLVPNNALPARRKIRLGAKCIAKKASAVPTEQSVLLCCCYIIQSTPGEPAKTKTWA